MGKYYVYAHYRPNDGKIFYIGKGCDRRAYEHESRNKHWRAIVKKYGGFTVEIIHDDLDDTLAKMLECSYIHCYGREDLKEGPLANKTDGGEGTSGRKYSKETRAKIGAYSKTRRHTEETKTKISKSVGGANHPNFGKKHGKSTLKKMSMVKRGKLNPRFGIHLSEETKAKITQTKKETREEKHA